MIQIFLQKTGWTIANTGDPDQTPHFAASDLDLQCLPVTRLVALQKLTLFTYLFIHFWKPPPQKKQNKEKPHKNKQMLGSPLR